MNSFAGDIYLLLVLAFTFRPTETQEQCVCMEITPPSSVNLSVSQPTTTTTAIVNGRAEFHCDVSMKSSYTDNLIVNITDDPIVYWYKHCPSSFTRKTVFSGKSAPEEYINRANQTVHEIQEHSNLRRRRFTLEIFQLNLNDSGDYFCVIKIRTRYGPYGDCGGRTRLEVVEATSSATPLITSNSAKSSSTTKIPKGTNGYETPIYIGVSILVLMIAATVLVVVRTQRKKRPPERFNSEPGNGTIEGNLEPDTELTYASVYIPPRNGAPVENKKEGGMDGIYSVVTYEPKSETNL
uniref:uncharacterized protein isoform X1 n=1 Tax=Myxine glutinosa TaxID=7769 RepID=UPI00358FA472